MTRERQPVEEWGFDDIFSVEQRQEIVAETSAHDETTQRRFWTPKKIISGMIAASIAVTAASIGPPIVENIKVSSRNTEKTCDPPSPKNIQKVQSLFGSPTPNGTSKDPKDYGLTVHDSYDTLSSITAVDSSTPKGFEKMLKVANKAMSRYGIKISVIDKDEADKEDKKVPDNTLLTDNDTEADMRYIVEGTMGLPVEYDKFSEVRRIVGYHGDTGDDEKAYVHITNDTDQHKHTEYYELSDAADSATQPHEFFHKVDRKQCGSYMAMENDPAFTGPNPGEIYEDDGHNHTNLKSLEEFERDKASVQHLVDEAIRRGDRKGYCNFINQQKKAEKQVVVARDYGFKNAKEDKAVMGEILARPDLFDSFLDPDKPILKKKFEVILARLYEKLPNFVKYLAAVSTRPKPDMSQYQC